jgi:hypothetical protein
VPAVGIAALLASGPLTISVPKPPPAPPLFDPPATTCPSPPSPTLGNFAAERARIGYAKRERSPFSRADGIEAVNLLETAAACFRTAGLLDDERETRSVAVQLRARLEDEYHTRRVRLEHAANVKDAVAAKRELNILVPLLAHREGPYIDWLQATDRWASTESARRRKKL